MIVNVIHANEILFKVYYYIYFIITLYMCGSLCVFAYMQMTTDDKRAFQLSGNWCYRRLWASQHEQVLGTELRPFVEATSTLNSWVIFQSQDILNSIFSLCLSSESHTVCSIYISISLWLSSIKLMKHPIKFSPPLLQTGVLESMTGETSSCSGPNLSSNPSTNVLMEEV